MSSTINEQSPDFPRALYAEWKPCSGSFQLIKPFAGGMRGSSTILIPTGGKKRQSFVSSSLTLLIVWGFVNSYVEFSQEDGTNV